MILRCRITLSVLLGRLMNLRDNAMTIISSLLDEFRLKNLDIGVVRVW